MKRKVIQIISAVFVTQCFLCSIPAHAVMQDINIPAQFGTVKEIFNPENPDISRDHTIIQIQDAHCNYEAQKNLAAILEYLIKEKKLRLIMVEGGSEDVSLAFLRSYADKATRERVADKYLRQGKISGEEYLDIVSDYDIELYGIEDRALYEDNLDAFLSSESSRQAALSDAASLSAVVEALKERIYPPAFLDLEDKKKELEENKIDLAGYVSGLKQLAEDIRLDMRNYPDLYAFSESAQLESGIDFKAAESERADCIKELAGNLDAEEFKGLLAKTQDFKANKISDAEYYSFLKSMADQKMDMRRNYPELFAYIQYISFSKKINTAALIKDQSALEERIAQALCVEAGQKELYEISRRLELLKRFLSLALTPEEYEVFIKDKASLLTASWTGFLADNCRKYNLVGTPVVSSAIDDNIGKLEEFYKLGLAREKSFIKNIKDKMDSSEDKVAVLITGGFHTPGISRLLKEQGFSYEVVTPVITKKSDPSIYFSVLRGEKTNAAEAISESEYEYTEEE